METIKKQDSQGIIRTFFITTCHECLKPIERLKSRLKEKNYCLECLNKKTETTCSFCNLKFFIRPSRLNPKSGFVFCSRKCKDEAQKAKHGFDKLHPRFDSKNYHYRTKAFDHLAPKCNICNYNKHIEVLEVHHKNCNRENNDISNLEILCPTCHTEKHFLSKTGKYK